MLQQTRVETVIPYYERWMERFPDLDALASAATDDVLRAWEGLGYYSRARHLQQAARLVRERHGGEVPEDAPDLRALPGIGDYTAGAIASIAFGRVEPAVDGNVRRVFARLTDDPAPAHAAVRRLVRELVDPHRPGDFNQALMDLGATVCTPRSPLCFRCPVSTWCAAWRHGTQEQRPAPKAARAVPAFDVGTLVITRGDDVLLERRPDHGLLAGLWTFPGRVVAQAETPRDAARRALAATLARVPRVRLPEIGRVEHTFSHRREIYHVLRARLRAPIHPSGRARWVALAEIGEYPLPRAQRRIAAHAGLSVG